MLPPTSLWKSLIKASLIKCCVSGTVPGSENSKMKNGAFVSVALQTDQGRWCCAWPVEGTVETVVLGKLHTVWNP